MNEPFRMRRVTVVITDKHRPSRHQKCSVGPAGNEPFPWMSKRFKQWAVRWTNSHGAGSTYCVSRKAAEAEMARYLRQPSITDGTAYIEAV